MGAVIEPTFKAGALENNILGRCKNVIDTDDLGLGIGKRSGIGKVNLQM